MVLVRCGPISPSLRISRKLKCIEKVFDILKPDQVSDILDYAKKLDLDSEVDVDRLMNYISEKYIITFKFDDEEEEEEEYDIEYESDSKKLAFQDVFEDLLIRRPYKPYTNLF
jgi:hypothetical protein